MGLGGKETGNMQYSPPAGLRDFADAVTAVQAAFTSDFISSLCPGPCSVVTSSEEFSYFPLR